MPQLIGIALVGGLVWYGYRALRREMERINRETRAAEKREEEARRGRGLVEGEDGVYRPDSPDET